MDGLWAWSSSFLRLFQNAENDIVVIEIIWNGM